MTKRTKKSLLLGLGIFATLVAAVAIIFVVRKPAPLPKASPTPKPFSDVVSPAPAEVFEVAQAACSTTFTVACASSSPSASPSHSPSPSASASPSSSPTASVSPSPSSIASVSPSPSPSVLTANLDCVAKEVYADDSRNRAGFYYLDNRIADASTLESGTTVTYNVVLRNSGGLAVPDTRISDVLSSNLTFVDSDSDCSYDSTSRTVSCTVGTVNAGAQTQRSFRARINVASTTSIANTAEVYSSNGQRDTCSIQLTGNGKVVVNPSPVPTTLPTAGVFEVTTGTLGVGLLLLLLGALGLLLM